METNTISTKRVSLADAKAQLGFDGSDLSPDCVSLVSVFQDGVFIGFYEVNADGSFSCTVFNDSEWSRDENVVRAFLVEHSEFSS